MAISFVDVQTDFGTANTTSITIAKPVGLQVGDLLIAYIGGNLQTLTAPSGWTQYQSDDSGNFRDWIYYCVATTTQVNATDFTWSLASAVPLFGAIVAYRGVDGSNPLLASNDVTITTTTDPVTTPSVTTTAGSSLLLHSRLCRDDTATPITYTGTGTERFDGGNNGASTAYSGAMYEAASPVAAGTHSGVSINASGTPTNSFARTLALRAEASTDAPAEAAEASAVAYDATVQISTVSEAAEAQAEAPDASGIGVVPTDSGDMNATPGMAWVGAAQPGRPVEGDPATVAFPESAAAAATADDATTGVETNAEAAEASAIAYDATVVITTDAEAATAAATADNATVDVLEPNRAFPDTAEASAVAYDATVIIETNAEAATAAATAEAPSGTLEVFPAEATATATAEDATTAVTAFSEAATASAAASDATAEVASGHLELVGPSPVFLAGAETRVQGPRVARVRAETRTTIVRR